MERYSKLFSKMSPQPRLHVAHNFSKLNNFQKKLKQFIERKKQTKRGHFFFAFDPNNK